MSGTVTDTTGGALPGVSITAAHTASGNVFSAVTDENGAFRIAVRTGSYQVTAELSSFGTVARNLELLVGQNAVLKLEMTLATLEENITVTGQAPLIDVATSTLGGNVDPLADARAAAERPELRRSHDARRGQPAERLV